MNETNLLKYSLNGEEIGYLNPDANIILYTQLNTLNDIDEIFKNSDKVIILYLLQSKRSGHWVTIFKNRKKKIIEFFSSYGVPPDAELDLLTKEQRKELNQKTNKLKQLCDKYRGIVFYNNICYQKPNTTTCGCWVTHRLLLSHLDDYEYLNFFIKNDIKNADLFVAEYCYKRLKNI